MNSYYDTTQTRESTVRARLGRAFKALRTPIKFSPRGIAARANFTCCQSCGCSQMAKNYKATRDGYVFWHRQDDESLRDEGQVFLSFGSYTDQFSAGLIGDRIVEALRAEGLLVEWDESEHTRIFVAGCAN